MWVRDLLQLRDRIGNVGFPLAVIAFGVYLGWCAFAAARAADQAQCVWTDGAWVSSSAHPRRFRRTVARYYWLAAFEWSAVVAFIVAAVLCWAGVITL